MINKGDRQQSQNEVKLIKIRGHGRSNQLSALTRRTFHIENIDVSSNDKIKTDRGATIAPWIHTAEARPLSYRPSPLPGETTTLYEC